MGGVVDTCIFAACERRGWDAQQTVDYIRVSYEGALALSSVTAMELVQGIYRAKSDEQAQGRRQFIQDILTAMPPIAFSDNTAWVAGRIRGEEARRGNTLPYADSMIAATALELGMTVITFNTADFIRIPGLPVITPTRP